ncbi:MAG: murein biosynthesis integral membrane protein MurJ [Candidatus Aminicenantes bacterium]|nr:murein biosynthesis integral membrane protein MurJ [Candidatus Aminicenantes bacterium]
MSSEQDQNRRLMRSTLAVSIPTVLSRVLGYVRDLLQAYFLGTSGSADAFNIAYTIPNLLRRLMGEGAMTAAFIPVFTQLKKEETKEALWKFANHFFFNLTLIMAVLTVLGVITTPFLVRLMASLGQDMAKIHLTVLLTRIMFPYMFLISMAALSMAILNSFRKFFLPAFTPVLLNLSIITVTLLFARKAEEPAVIFAVGVVIGGFLQLAVQIPALWKQGMRFGFGINFKHPAVRKVARLMVPGIFGVGIVQINFAISKAMAWSLGEGSVASLNYSIRVQELTLGIFSIAFSIALLPTFSELAAHRDLASMKKTLMFAFRLVGFITLPAMVGLMVLSRPIIQVLFEHGVFDAQSTAMTAPCLLFFALGLPFISCVKILAPAFYSLKDTRTPVFVAFFVMITYISLGFLLMGPMRTSGLALALAVSSVLNCFLLFYLLEKKIGRVDKRTILFSILRSLAAALLMGGGIAGAQILFPFRDLHLMGRLGLLAAVIALGLGIYVGISLLINRDEIKGVRRLFSREKILKGESRS